MGSTLKWVPRLSGLAFVLNCEWFAIVAQQFDIAAPEDALECFNSLQNTSLPKLVVEC